MYEFFRRLICEVCYLLLLLRSDSDSDGYSEIVRSDDTLFFNLCWIRVVAGISLKVR